MKKIVALALLTTVPVLAAAGCGKDSGDDDDDDGAGPIDGSWQVTELTCDGFAQAIPLFTVNIDGDVGTFVLSMPGTCTATFTEEYGYPDASTIEITPTAASCSPDAASCAPVFGGATDCPTPPPTDFAHGTTGGGITFTRVSAGPQDNCPAGQTVRYVMIPAP